MIREHFEKCNRAFGNFHCNFKNYTAYHAADSIGFVGSYFPLARNKLALIASNCALTFCWSAGFH